MDMSSKNDSKWYQNYEALEAYIQERGHLPDKHVVENRALLSWAKYQRKKIKAGTLDTEKRELFESLLATRSTEHTWGRRKKETGTSVPQPLVCHLPCSMNCTRDDAEDCKS